ncbi:MAG: hypothetical protein NC079_07195 [Clostridium sp.]|nr:hypothetical protein [Acetatifactor muris]MCM1527676.1 hypothetical protein [Bacteroides sp.]MCM1563380.1 hypothetical protein [Clostridium sp.]
MEPENIRDGKWILCAVAFLCGIFLICRCVPGEAKAETMSYELGEEIEEEIGEPKSGAEAYGEIGEPESDAEAYGDAADPSVVLFEAADLAAIGFVDMQIAMTGHMTGLPAVSDEDKADGAKTDEPSLISWMVEEGDCLWEIARETYGDGSRYLEIYDSNRELIGEDPRLIRVGMELVLPAG